MEKNNIYKVIASGSQGNCVIYHGVILTDIGIPFALLSSFLYQIKLVLLTHEHHDHINLSTLQSLCKNRPTLRVGCCEWMLKHIEGIRNIDVYEIGQEYDYGSFKIIPVKLYHDVPNCGYRIITPEYKIFHATDTKHLEGISAKNYDLYAIEHNYNEDTVYSTIQKKESKGEFAHERLSINSHLSEQKARQFIYKNKGINYEVLRLHEPQIVLIK
jgi:phosphoribosyl 1,2-cyclic phosphodiesterase